MGVDELKVFVTSKYRRMRTLAIISVIHHTGLRVSVVSVGKAGRIADSHGIAFVASAAGRRTSFSTCRKVVLPNNVPKAIRLKRSSAIDRIVHRFTGRKGLITTVYTTPDILKRTKVLGKGGTTYRPKFRRGLAKTRMFFSPMMYSKGIVADHNVKATMPFNLTITHCFASSTAVRRMGTKLMCTWANSEGYRLFILVVPLILIALCSNA